MIDASGCMIHVWLSGTIRAAGRPCVRPVFGRHFAR